MLEVEPRVVKLNGAGPDTTTEYYGVTYENLTAHLVRDNGEGTKRDHK